MIIVILTLLLVCIIFLFKRRKIVFNSILNNNYKIIWQPITLIILSGVFTALSVFSQKSMDKSYIGISALFVISLEMIVYNFMCSNELYELLKKKESIERNEFRLFSGFFWLALIPLGIFTLLRTGLHALWLSGIIMLLGFLVYYEMIKKLKGQSKSSTKNLLPLKLRFKSVKNMAFWDIGIAILLMVAAVICNTFLPTKLLKNTVAVVISIIIFMWAILLNFNCLSFFEDSKKYAKNYIGLLIPPCLVIIYLVEYYFYHL